MEQTHSKNKVLVVDDEPDIRNGLSRSLQEMGYDVASAESGEDALYQMKNMSDLSFVITDFKMPGLDGFGLLKQVKKTLPHVPVVIMTGHGSVQHAVDAMRMGADDYLCKPFRFEDLEKIIVKGCPKEEVNESRTILSADQNFLELLQKAQRAARSTAPILIEGPSGTGKELLARQIHEWSLRKSKPWVAVNCAALPAGLLESELFGFEKGSFTGALEKRVGKFEQANAGTLLLDEIGELDPMLQAKLLRVLQEGEIDRIGGRKPMKVDVRIIATTNKNLEQLVRLGKFREDLFFRLYGVRFDMPALSCRRNDISLLAEEFLKRQSQEQERELYFAAGILDFLKSLDWPGNVRELERAVERASILSESGRIEIENFEFSAPTKSFQFDEFQAEVQTIAKENKTIREMEKKIILQTLKTHNGNRTHTAKALGMSLRTLRHKLKQYREEGIEVSPTRQDALGKNVQRIVPDAGPGV